MGGTSQLAPLLVNVACGVGTLLVVYIILRKVGLPQIYQAAVLLGMVFLTPLPAIIFTGMEHTLQMGSFLLFVYVVAHDLAGEKGARVGASAGLWVLAAVCPLIRYEGLSLVFVACLLFFARRRWQEAFGLGLVAVFPLAIYGAISAVHGWYWLPTSIFMKANVPRVIGNVRILPDMNSWDGWTRATILWSMGPALLMLLALLVYRRRTLWRESSIMIVLVASAVGLHLRFARLGTLLRYEAYLVALCLLVLSVGAFEYLSERRGRASSRFETTLACGWLGYSLLFPLVVLVLSGYGLRSRTPQAGHNTYEQQYQMGLFLRQFYYGAPIAANDIGVVSYMAEPHLEELVVNRQLGCGETAAQGCAYPPTNIRVNQVQGN